MPPFPLCHFPFAVPHFATPASHSPLFPTTYLFSLHALAAAGQEWEGWMDAWPGGMAPPSPLPPSPFLSLPSTIFCTFSVSRLGYFYHHPLSSVPPPVVLPFLHGACMPPPPPTPPPPYLPTPPPSSLRHVYMYVYKYLYYLCSAFLWTMRGDRIGLEKERRKEGQKLLVVGLTGWAWCLLPACHLPACFSPLFCLTYTLPFAFLGYPTAPATTHPFLLPACLATPLHPLTHHCISSCLVPPAWWLFYTPLRALLPAPNQAFPTFPFTCLPASHKHCYLHLCLIPFRLGFSHIYAFPTLPAYLGQQRPLLLPHLCLETHHTHFPSFPLLPPLPVLPPPTLQHQPVLSVLPLLTTTFPSLPTTGTVCHYRCLTCLPPSPTKFI